MSVSILTILSRLICRKTSIPKASKHIDIQTLNLDVWISTYFDHNRVNVSRNNGCKKSRDGQNRRKINELHGEMREMLVIFRRPAPKECWEEKKKLSSRLLNECLESEQ